MFTPMHTNRHCPRLINRSINLAVRTRAEEEQATRTVRLLPVIAGLFVRSAIIIAAGAATLAPARSAEIFFPYQTFRWVWGENEKGELGNFSDQDADHPILSSGFLPSGVLLTRLAAGSNSPLLGSHSLALDRNGDVWAWGNNPYGQAGSGNAGSTVFGPQRICVGGQTQPCSEFLGDVMAIAAGGLHSLALDIHSNVWGWGYNGSGQLGSNVGNTAIPVRNNALFAQLHQLPGPPLVVAIAAGAHHSLALDSRGVVWAWGANESGQLGLGYNGSGEVYALQITFPESAVITAIAAGSYYSLALDSQGNVWSWGANDVGQLGISSFDAKHNTPQKLVYFPPLTRITAISAGGGFALALDSGGNVWAWGANGGGQLGNAQNIEQRSPTRTVFPDGTPRIRSISAGGGHSLAIDANYNAWAWGTNGSGQLGNRQAPFASNVPVRVDFPEGTRVSVIAAGGFHSLALESRSFLFDLEAVLDLDLVKAKARLLPQSLTQLPIDVQTTSVARDRAGNRTRVTHSLTDLADNKLVLVFTEQRIGGDDVAFQIESVQYNDGAVAMMPRNRIEYHSKTDPKTGQVDVLQQHLQLADVNGVTNITAHYVASRNQTSIDVHTPAGPERYIAPGMVTLQISTINGELAFSDGEHVWPAR